MDYGVFLYAFHAFLLKSAPHPQILIPITAALTRNSWLNAFNIGHTIVNLANGWFSSF